MCHDPQPPSVRHLKAFFIPSAEFCSFFTVCASFPSPGRSACLWTEAPAGCRSGPDRRVTTTGQFAAWRCHLVYMHRRRISGWMSHVCAPCSPSPDLSHKVAIFTYAISHELMAPYDCRGQWCCAGWKLWQLDDGAITDFRSEYILGVASFHPVLRLTMHLRCPLQCATQGSGLRDLCNKCCLNSILQCPAYTELFRGLPLEWQAQSSCKFDALQPSSICISPW